MHLGLCFTAFGTILYLSLQQSMCFDVWQSSITNQQYQMWHKEVPVNSLNWRLTELTHSPKSKTQNGMNSPPHHAPSGQLLYPVKYAIFPHGPMRLQPSVLPPYPATSSERAHTMCDYSLMLTSCILHFTMMIQHIIMFSLNKWALLQELTRNNRIWIWIWF